MSPPTIPPWSPSPGDIQTANIIIEALKQAGYDAGVASPDNEWKDFDIKLYRGNIVVGSKKRNKTWLFVHYNKNIITFRIVGHQFSPTKSGLLNGYDGDNFNLADPEALKKIANYIMTVVNNDWYKYPWI